jgi:hypothetical protein
MPAYIIDPSGTKSRIAIRTSKLTSAIETDFQRSKIDIILDGGVDCFMQGLYGINFTFVHTVTHSVSVHVFNLPAVFTPAGTFSSQHFTPVFFLLISIVQQPRVVIDFINVNQMGWRVMATCGLPTS